MPTQDLPLGPKFEKALGYAAHAHSAQKRKGSGIPYVAHLLSVAALVIEDGGTENEAIAALLHDAIEDQGGLERREEILSLFGEEVVRIVDGCTDSWETPKPPWRQRKESHIQHLRQAPADVLRVAIADKLHNARSILLDLRVNGDTVWTRFRGGKDGTLWYYRTIGAVLEDAAAGPMVDELIRVVREMESLAAGDGSWS
jgi:(p)ppGpp synthase/HD superfamily hydrolase